MTVEIERSYNHPVTLVWRALTEPELHAKWWAKGDVRPIVGHRFTLDMDKWGQQPCEVLEVVPERRLRYAFAQGTLDTTITRELAPEGSDCRLVLVHEGFDVDSPMGRAALEGTGAGGPAILDRIATALAA